ncbi:plasminogen-like [Lineus longissimus]|uniref:plasminogen-like n=1 Tax=Lineus longissimus TaxID=88925 RepID=UPI00315D7ED4
MRTFVLTILVALTCVMARRGDSAVSETRVNKECKDSPSGIEYRGTLSKTRGGFTCQAWASNSPHTHELIPDSEDDSAALNHCRNPDGGKEPWCFTADPKKTYDYCDVPFCDPEEKVSLTASLTGDMIKIPSIDDKKVPFDIDEQKFPDLADVDENIRTEKNDVPSVSADEKKVPFEGEDKTVPNWPNVDEKMVPTRTEDKEVPSGTGDKKVPSHTGAPEDKNAPSGIKGTTIIPDKISTKASVKKKVSTAVKGFKIGSNRGRLSYKGTGHEGSYKPSKISKEKVHTKKKDGVKKPSVDVGVIPESKQGDCKSTRKGTEYSGTLNKTRRNYTCQMWASNSPHEVKSSPKNKTAASNYCRNPSSRKGPWCYTTDPKKKKDLCDIPLCVGARSGRTRGYKLKNQICGKRSYARGTNVSFRDCKKECDNDNNCKSFCYTTPFASKPPKSECQLFETSCEGFLAAPRWPKSMGMEDMLIPHHYIKKTKKTKN